ncbi:hypothetical protein [Streptomyces rubiginosohelvolus]|uniref:hypothetical protein n=1 Tax=Streptomyces rubiginosohelvolus TaxID=67362 RepID=UPI0036ED7318
MAVKVALAVVGYAVEWAAGGCGEFRDSPADQAGADRGFVEVGKADEGGGRGPPHPRVCGIQVRGDVLSRGRRSEEAGSEQRGGGGDRVLLVFGKGEETGQGGGGELGKPGQQVGDPGPQTGVIIIEQDEKAREFGQDSVVRLERRPPGVRRVTRRHPLPQLLQLRALVAGALTA